MRVFICEYCKEKSEGTNPKQYICSKCSIGLSATWKGKLWLSSYRRAKAKGLSHNITLEDIIIPDKCPVFETALLERVGESIQHHQASLDRVNNHLGYVKGNVRVISLKANNMKSDHDVCELEECIEGLRKIIDYINSHK